jgi:hypothetical protein
LFFEDRAVSEIVGLVFRLTHRAGCRQALEISMMKNKVVRVEVSGGIIGVLIGSPRASLTRVIDAENAQGWRVRQVLADPFANALQQLIRLLILILTIFLWTPATGFYVVFEREGP